MPITIGGTWFCVESKNKKNKNTSEDRVPPQFLNGRIINYIFFEFFQEIKLAVIY